MAKIAVGVRVFPSDINLSLEELLKRIEKSLPPEYSVATYMEIPIAFGYKVLRVIVLMPENVEGGTDQLETLLSSVEGVDQIEVEFVHRVSE
ncbi:MAG: elongation factor 1-beta [Acidilobaceae archaeon]